MNDEEWKSNNEPQKILGCVQTREELEEERAKLERGEESGIIPIYTDTNRVPAQKGHLERVLVTFERPTSTNDVRKALEEYEHKIPNYVRVLPTTPDKLFHLMKRSPKHTDLGDGTMDILVGDITQEGPCTVGMKTLSDNLRRGATWAGRQGLELYLSKYKGMELP